MADRRRKVDRATATYRSLAPAARRLLRGRHRSRRPDLRVGGTPDVSDAGTRPPRLATGKFLEVVRVPNPGAARARCRADGSRAEAGRTTGTAPAPRDLVR